MARWFAFPQILLHRAGAAACRPLPFRLVPWTTKGRELVPFLASLGLFLLSYRHRHQLLSLYRAAHPLHLGCRSTGSEPGFLLIGTAPLVPLILAYTAYAYWVFRGKTGSFYR